MLAGSLIARMNQKLQYQVFLINQELRQKYLEFYHANEEYRNKTLARLDKEQKKYWSNSKNRELQAERVKKYFEINRILNDSIIYLNKFYDSFHFCNFS